MALSRRALFGGLAALAAPAIIRTPGILMPIKTMAAPSMVLEIESLLRTHYDPAKLQLRAYVFKDYADQVLNFQISGGMSNAS